MGWPGSQVKASFFGLSIGSPLILHVECGFAPRPTIFGGLSSRSSRPGKPSAGTNRAGKKHRLEPVGVAQGSGEDLDCGVAVGLSLGFDALMALPRSWMRPASPQMAHKPCPESLGWW